MIQQSHIESVKEVGALSLTNIAGWLIGGIMPWITAAATLAFVLLRAYSAWLDVKLKRKLLKEGPDAQHELPKGD